MIVAGIRALAMTQLIRTPFIGTGRGLKKGASGPPASTEAVRPV